MTSTEANEFFANRTVEKVGEDTDKTSTHVGRLQTERPNTRVKGRIVVTLNYEIPRDDWQDHDNDAVDLLRREVDLLRARNIKDEAEFGAAMSELFDGSTGWSIEAAK